MHPISSMWTRVAAVCFVGLKLGFADIMTPAGYERIGSGSCTTSGHVPSDYISDQPVADIEGCALVCNADENCKFISVVGAPLPFECLVHRSLTCDTRQVSADLPNASHVFAQKKHLAHADHWIKKEGAELVGNGTCANGVYDSISPGSPVACAAMCTAKKDCTFFSVGQRQPYECVFYNSYSCDERDVDSAFPDKHLTFKNTKGLDRLKAAVAKEGAELVGEGYCTTGIINTTSPCTAADGAAYCSKDLRCKYFSLLQWSPFTCTLHDSTDCEDSLIISDPEKPSTALVFDMQKASMAMKFEEHDAAPIDVSVIPRRISFISSVVLLVAIGMLGVVSFRLSRSASASQQELGGLMETELEEPMQSERS